MLFRKSFTFKIKDFRKLLLLKFVLFKNARKTQNLRILLGKLNQNVIFCVQKFFQNLLPKFNFFSKIMFFKNIFLKIWRVVKILIQNLTRCKKFISKFDTF